MNLSVGKLCISWLLVISSLSLITGVASSQITQSTWDEPVNISNMATDSVHPVVVSDPSGSVHVFWAENIPRYGTFNNVIYYVNIEGSTPSLPVAIITPPQGLQAMADFPDVVVGNDHRLHLVFVSGYNGSIYYSSASLKLAGNSRSWTKPLLISGDIIKSSNPNIAMDPQGRLHVVFQSISSQGQGIYHVLFDPETVRWSFPSVLPGSDLGIDFILGDTRLAIGPDGGLHVAWMWTHAKVSYPPKGIYYAHSIDPDGETWTIPQLFAEGPYEFPEIGFDGDGTLLLIWSGTHPDRYKFFKWSKDNGNTWSGTGKVPFLAGFQGYAGLANDSTGRLHLAMVGSHSVQGDGLFHLEWVNGEWLGPDTLLLNTHDDQNLMFSDFAISQGNQAHIVVMYPIEKGELPEGDISANTYQFEIYYIFGRLNAPALGVEPLLDEQPDPNELEVRPGQSSETTDLPTPIPAPVNPDPVFIEREVDISRVILLGALPVILFWIVIFALKKIKSRHI